ncbi:Spy/CpxP family protein refolding chaperone [Ulvibacterium sp.]|uniref:Spy/CpxP family protein refolding chaperone n=1 Tax=Ulvibacterium sp. TaxID=2665914 RepID=UPI00262C8C27|nr:Spy/CpxP family protein refolding chaperone [Ulvibacterium sp.]
MKKIVVLVTLLTGVTVMAQEGRKNHHRAAMKDLTPEQIATLHTKKMTLALDLTEVQQKQIQVLSLENAKLRKAKMEERKAKRESGESKKPTSEERYTMQLERLDHQIAHKAEMKAILSPEQYEKWEKLHFHKRKHRGKEKHEGKRGK